MPSDPTKSSDGNGTVAHLPCYDDNLYQSLLMRGQESAGWRTIDGGGGGQFLRSALYRWKAKAIHFHWLHPYMLRPSRTGTICRSIQFLIELALLRFSGKRLVWTLHNIRNHAGQHVGLEHWFLRRATRFFDQVVCHSHWSAGEAQEILRIDPKKIKVIPHGNYIGAYPSGTSKKAARQKLGIAMESRVFVCVGRIAAYKGLGDLVEAFCKIALDSEMLIIAGRAIDDAQVSELLQICKGDQRVRIDEGFVPDEELQTYFAAADIAVFPFRSITNSGSVILAMSFGKACIAADLGGLAELLDDQDQLFDSKSPQGLMDSIVRHRDLDADKIGARNLERASQWGWEKLAKETIEAYSNV